MNIFLISLLGFVGKNAMAKDIWGQKVEYVPGEYIVKVKKGAKHRLLTRKFSDKYEINREIPVDYADFFVIKSSESNFENVVNDFKTLPEIEYIEPNFIYRIIESEYNAKATALALGRYRVGDPDPLFNQLWGLNNTGSNEPNPENIKSISGVDIDAKKAWSRYGKGDRSVKVAVIDTGIDYRHADLAANILINEAEKNGKRGVDDDGNGYVDDIYGWDFAGKDNNPIDGHSHGTHCAGTIAAEHNNGIGVAGVMGEASLLAVKFLSDGGSGSTEDAILAVNYATQRGVDIMSNSWGGGGYSQALKEAIEVAANKGIIFVAAAGNSSSNNDTTPTYPANYEVENIISVAAHNSDDNLATFSCFGRNTVHIAAPGRNILSTIKNGGYAVYSGTSMATPHVSGALGMLASKENLKDLGFSRVKDRLMKTSIPIASYRGKTISGGRLHLTNLLSNTRPTRIGPNPNDWEDLILERPFESKHPYDNSSDVSRSFHVLGVKYMRVVVKKFDIENGYDALSVIDKNNHLIENIYGMSVNYISDYVEGDTLNLKFTSDSSVSKWGYLVEKIQYIK